MNNSRALLSFTRINVVWQTYPKGNIKGQESVLDVEISSHVLLREKNRMQQFFLKMIPTHLIICLKVAHTKAFL